MDLKTTYLGFELEHPLMPGASPMVDDLDMVRRLEDAGASAIVLHSLFEEQLTGEQMVTHQAMEQAAESHAEAQSYMPSPSDFALGPEEYLDQLRRIKEAVAVPVIASLNGTSDGGWLEFARLLAEAGADALELNIYRLSTDVNISGAEIEEHTLAMVRDVKAAVSLPLAVKLSPYYSALAHFAAALDREGADGLILFNRFYQADIDIESLELVRSLRLSDPSELLLRLRWLAILSGRLEASLAVTGGVHNVVDVIKAVMSGAHAVQLVSVLLRHGPERLATLRRHLAEWLEEHDYESLRQMQGSMNLQRSPDPQAYERANYVDILQGWRPSS